MLARFNCNNKTRDFADECATDRAEPIAGLAVDRGGIFYGTASIRALAALPSGSGTQGLDGASTCSTNDTTYDTLKSGAIVAPK
jgi:hypothetical protein